VNPQELKERKAACLQKVYEKYGDSILGLSLELVLEEVWDQLIKLYEAQDEKKQTDEDAKS